MRLDPAHFDDWFRALNGLPADQGPFPWQRRLFRDWLCPTDSDRARWPCWLELPTASGKTALIDLAVLALACGSPCARRRIVFIVDRRVVVDEAARRAEVIAARLKCALDDPASPLSEVAKALLALGGEEPLLVATLRGGIPSDDRWARSPAQPCVILSTVDQVGSRLLFRAYGDAGPRAWPIHAGLLGRDTLLLIDEAHCARPFCQTANLIATKWQHFADIPVGKPIEAVFLSATLGESADFRLEEKDRAHPVLQRRLEASKPVELVQKEGRKGGREALVEAIRSRAEKTLQAMRGGVLGIIVNRVRDARALYEALPLYPSRKLLLTGKARPWERDRLLADWLPHLEAGARERPKEPVAVVATQCVEVGANLDFDFLITEIAPLDALRQRFGRLDRLGDRAARREQIGASDLPCGAIVAASSQVELDKNGAVKNPDPIYGMALCHTWHWLAEQASGSPPQVDFGIAQLEALVPASEELARLCQPAREAYRLLPAHLDLLVQTSPPPEPDPEISAFLHGVTQAGPDVTIVWRGDLAEDDPDAWLDRVAVQPPSPGEGCTVPIWEVRQWLSAGGAPAEADGGDLEAAVAAGEAGGTGRKLLRWRGPSESEVVPASAIRPGDVVVVPAAYGGCDALGWHPASTAPVLDIGDATAFTAGRRPVLRLDSLDGHLGEAASEARELIEGLRSWASGEEEAPDPAAGLSRLAKIGSLPGWLRQLASHLAADGRRRALEIDGSFAIVGRRGGRGEDFTTAAETSLAAAPVGLAEHCRGVEHWVKRFTASIAIPDELGSDLAIAAWLHDVGKADPRFQAWLHGGDEIAASLAAQPLAKSALSARDWRVLRRARRLARYPDGARHEVQSVALICSVAQLREQARDWDLVLHLVAAHHGFARPFVPVAVDPDPVEIELEFDGLALRGRSDHHLQRLDSGIAERFWMLVRRYGWWGLAYLEAIVRLADHRCSEEEETREGNDGGR